ncbi:hypothetical protein GCM10010910_29180 [Microbacterium nanhaiense]|uniref:SCP domain-containing protein n=1 Tax=Microbacterium nanhaiense TaxID=1301026 RepID=A0ABQ2N5G2_9MICO|nr:CAP domain-containing protein [Microbacterium nanhaiense]GGO67429.1 hypothetical protein GCM10010910_29180 [Microbacterium nanhaiense]
MVFARARIHRALISVLVASVLVAGGATAAAAETPAGEPPPAEQVAARGGTAPFAANVELVKAQILVATNNARIRAGLRPVAPSPKLGSVAQNWANSYDQHGYEHNPRLLADAGGWDYGWTGGLYENMHLAPDGIRGVQGWLDSPAHRAHLLDPEVDRIGIGVAVAEDGRYFMVQEFSTGGSGRARDADPSMYTATSDPDDPRGGVSAITVPRDGVITIAGRVTDPSSPGSRITLRYAIHSTWASAKTAPDGSFSISIGPYATADDYEVQVLAENLGAGNRVTLWRGTATNRKSNAHHNKAHAEAVVPPALSAETGAKTVPVYRFWSSTFDNAHFYTVSRDEADALSSGDPNWRFEGEDFRVWAANDARCGDGKSPVYRFWSSTFESHFYTLSRREADTIRREDKNWSYEGVAFCAASAPSTATKPVYRFWSARFGKHFFTANAAEAEALRRGDKNWSYEGIALYAAK